MAKFLDQVSAEQKGQIKKASTQRLYKWLVDSGISEDEADKLNREQLMEAWAEAVFTGKDEKKSVGATAKIGYDPEVERERLAFEKERWEAERADRLKREAAEQDMRLKREAAEQDLRLR